MASTNILSVAAEEGFKDATAYDAYRPSYPPEAVEKFFKGMKLAGTSDARVVEIASGTGKFTEQLANQPERYLIKAIEPHETMRQKLAEKDLPAVEVLNGSASKMPVDNEWGDACIAAQVCYTRAMIRIGANSDSRHSIGKSKPGNPSFYKVLTWRNRFSTQEALDEIHRVLKPGAVFGMIWNIDNYNNPKGWEAATKWEQKLNDFVWSLDDGHSRFRHMVTNLPQLKHTRADMNLRNGRKSLRSKPRATLFKLSRTRSWITFPSSLCLSVRTRSTGQFG